VRADAATRLLLIAARDAAILARADGDADDLGGLASFATRTPMDDLD
jgi:hypothetical protein